MTCTLRTAAGSAIWKFAWGVQLLFAATAPITLNAPIQDMHLMSPSSGWVLAGQHLFRTNTGGWSWSDITPPLTSGQAIDTVYFFDADHGWAILHADPTRDSQLLAIVIAATLDGGKSWSRATFPASMLLRQTYARTNQLSFSDEAHGWMLATHVSGSAASVADLYETQDGGATWSLLPSPPVSGGIQFLSGTTGWLCGGVYRDELYRTTDGGQTWVRKIITLPANVHPYRVPETGGTYVSHPIYEGPHFETIQAGILAVAVGVSSTGSASPIRYDRLNYFTADSGDTWQIRKIETGINGVGPLGFFGTSYVEVIQTDGVIAFHYSSRTVIASPPPGASHNLAIRKADFADAQHGWLLTASGSLLATQDGGRSIVRLLNALRPR